MSADIRCKRCDRNDLSILSNGYCTRCDTLLFGVFGGIKDGYMVHSEPPAKRFVDPSLIPDKGDDPHKLANGKIGHGG